MCLWNLLCWFLDCLLSMISWLIQQSFKSSFYKLISILRILLSDPYWLIILALTSPKYALFTLLWCSSPFTRVIVMNVLFALQDQLMSFFFPVVTKWFARTVHLCSTSVLFVDFLSLYMFTNLLYSVFLSFSCFFWEWLALRLFLL